MPDIPDRDHHESRLFNDLHRESRRQRKLLMDLMGYPARTHNVPEDVWRDEIKRGFSLAALAGLGMVFALSAGHLVEMLKRSFGKKNPPKPTIIIIGQQTTDIPDTSWRITPEDVAEKAYEWAEERADKLGGLWMDHTRERVEKAVATANAEGMTHVQFVEKVDPIFGEPRISVVSGNETTIATTGGGDFTAEKFQDENPEQIILKIWRHRERIVRGKHPCPLCAPLVGTSQNEWAAINPDAALGPPLHVGCDCSWEPFLITPQERRRLKLVPPRNWSEDYSAQYERIRTSRSLADAPQR